MHTLKVYTVRIYDSHRPGQSTAKYCPLNAVRDKNFIQELRTASRAQSRQLHQLQTPTTQLSYRLIPRTESPTTVSGLVEVGDYGVKSTIRSVDDGTVSYNKSANESDMYPMYFNFSIRNDLTSGLLITQSVGNRGIKTIIREFLNTRVTPLLYNLHIQLLPFTYEEALSQWFEEANVKELHLIHYREPTAVTDEVENLLPETVPEIVYKPPRRGDHFGQLRQFLRFRGQQPQHGDAVAVLGQHCERVRAQVDLAGRKRMFTLSSQSLPMSSIEITDQDVTFEDGVPRFDGLETYTNNLTQDIFNSIEQ